MLRGTPYLEMPRRTAWRFMGNHQDAGGLVQTQIITLPMNADTIRDEFVEHTLESAMHETIEAARETREDRNNLNAPDNDTPPSR